MSIYSRHVLPRIVNAACGMKPGDPLRERVCAGLEGEVVEIGFGSGLNVPFYPDRVTRVSAIEPADLGWKLAEKRLPPRPSRSSGRASTESRCLSETTASTPRFRRGRCARSLTSPRLFARFAASSSPEGTLHFVEHGLAPDESVRKWQHRLEPIQKRVFGGCHLTRQPADLSAAAGFSVPELDEFYEENAPKFLAADSLGVAVAS